MCYETTLTKKQKAIEKHFNVNLAVPLEYEPYYHRSGFSYQNLQIIKMDEPNMVYPASWGFVPEWGMNDISAFRKKYNTLNAKSETILSSGTYKNSARSKRCLIIADGFFEPHKDNGISIPHFCYIPTNHYKDNRDLFAFGGIYSEIDEETFSCSIITTEANDFFAEVHNVKKRMPLVFDEELYNEWFNENLKDENISELMKHGFTSKDFDAYPVSRDLYKRSIDTNNENILNKVK